MSESHNERIDVPELTADEIQARVLHRDGLMLVIDKPAGLPVHRGPKGGANLES
jgi:tRNA pseudouridine32 synthase/23S rRNA pseudouridine746 synthase